MTTTRSYRVALSQDVAAHELRANAGSQFDPEVVVAVLAVAATGVPIGEPTRELLVS
jgi:HD-GYP domain-containing protein (c-di-GMP phosphodiesterase class II)